MEVSRIIDRRRKKRARRRPSSPPPSRVGTRGLSWFDSAHVPHATRWALPLPDAATTRGDLSDSLADTLRLLALAPETDDGLYFFRLALFHEDMHAEAWVNMAQTLGIDPGETSPPPPCTPAAALLLDAGEWTLGAPEPWKVNANGVCPGGEITIGNRHGSRTIRVGSPFCDPTLRP